jgi:hypothetical protein
VGQHLAPLFGQPPVPQPRHWLGRAAALWVVIERRPTTSRTVSDEIQAVPPTYRGACAFQMDRAARRAYR